MAKITIKKEASLIYQRSTWQGTVEISGESITYRYSEDDNGAELYILQDNSWNQVDVSEGNYAILWASIMEWGTPEDMGTCGDTIDLDDEIIEDYI